ncbi:hypothetical protein ACFL3C_05285 [Patescibacteria group bacterium]
MVSKRPIGVITGEHIKSTLRGQRFKSLAEQGEVQSVSSTPDPTQEMTYKECMAEVEEVSKVVDAIIYGCKGIDPDSATPGELRRLSQSLNVLDRNITRLEEYGNACQLHARSEAGPVAMASNAQIELYAQLETAKDEDEIARINARIAALSERESEIKNKLKGIRTKIDEAKTFQTQTNDRVEQVMQGGKKPDLVISLPQFG